MPDMLCALYRLPQVPVCDGVVIRRAHAFEASQVISWVEKNFSKGWADEITGGYPAKVVVAVRGGSLVGFAAYDCTRPNFFGPTGVLESERGKGIGRALLITALAFMRDRGYAYAIIGGVGPAEFYTKTVGATIIPDSVESIYTNRIGAT